MRLLFLLPALLQTQPQFAPASQYFAGDHPVFSAITELNGDGRPDLLTSFSAVGVLLGNGGGSFAPVSIVTISSTYAPGPLLTGDLNGDGLNDVVACNGSYSQSTSYVLLGDGTGGLGTPVPFEAGGTGPHFGALGDFNIDGSLDLVMSCGTSGLLTLLKGNFAGGFGAPVTIASGGAGALAVGDLNGDATLDVVYLASPLSSLSVLLGLGPSGFVAGPGTSGTGLNPANLLLADFDHDGKLDEAMTWTTTGASTTTERRLGDGLGGFGAALTWTGPIVSGLSAGDVNGDANPDLVYAWKSPANSIAFALGLGDGQFVSAANTFSAGVAPTRPHVFDVDGDGRLDVVTTTGRAFYAQVLKNVTPLFPGLATYGVGSPGCFGPHGIGATAAPSVGNAAFAFTATSAPANSFAVVLVGNVPAAGLDPFGLGVNLLVDLVASNRLFTFALHADESGYAIAPAPIPNNPALVGASFDAQALFVWYFACPLASPLSLSTSAGLAVTLQP